MLLFVLMSCLIVYVGSRLQRRTVKSKWVKVNVIKYCILITATTALLTPKSQLSSNSSLDSTGIILTPPHFFTTPAYSHKCAIIRIFGNNLHPLQQQNQASRNLHTILTEESFIETPCVKVWVINRIINATEKSEIERLLRNESHVLEIKIDIEVLRSYGSRPKQALNHLTDINNARNEALLFARGLRVEWVILLDGNSFITSEGYNTLFSNLDYEFKSRGKILSFIPMSRLVEHNSYGFQLKHSHKLDQLRDRISNMQEPYLALHYNFLQQLQQQNHLLFDSRRSYGHQSKLYLLRQLVSQHSQFIACEDAFKKCALRTWKSTVEDFETTSRQCGYAIRMLYWPDRNPDKPREPSNSSPESSNGSRSHLRTLSVSYLIKTIQEFLHS